MIFNSLVFLIFVCLFFPLWRSIDRLWLRLTILVLMSFFFYGWWQWNFVFLLLLSGGIDFLAGIFIERMPGRKKNWLCFSVITNIGLLSFFKYSDLILSSLGNVLGFKWHGYKDAIPLGISFYTFQSMSYTIDIYRGRLVPTKNIIHFFAYLSCFPQLVAGPIVRAKELLPKLLEKKIPSQEDFFEGIKLIIAGYFFKVIIADNMALLVDSAFFNASVHKDSLYWWLVLGSFCIQVYGDFGGYSLIARGLLQCMGMPIGKNFDSPFMSTSLQEFWQRWHISLTSWFRDYVYLPLGGGKKNGTRNMFITTLFSAIWHGSSVRFFLWGLFHSFFIALERKTQFVQKLPGVYLQRLMIFLLMSWSVVYFRCQYPSMLWPIQVELFSFHFKASVWELIPGASLFAWSCYLSFVFLSHYGILDQIQKSKALTIVGLSLLICFIIFFRGSSEEFIYFAF